MASHVLVPFHPKQDEIQLVQDTPEEKENGGLEEKPGEKEFLPHSLPTHPEAIPYTTSFSTCFIPLQASPFIENQTPPPDPA
jgi:hypothetical protein